MASLRVLICGGGIAGPALAFWLARAGHDVTIVERFPSLRASGAQVDLRAQGIGVLKRMGLLDIVRSKLVDEAGVAFVDERNIPQATILANKSGRGAQSLTSEYEIMRGDLVQILHVATEQNVTYIFNNTVEGFEQDAEGVDVHFSDGKSGRYDLLVGADGQGSRIRKAILPEDSPDPLLRLRILTAYFFMPRIPDDTNVRKSYAAPKRRLMMCRSHSPTESQAYLFLQDDAEELSAIPKASMAEQKAFWRSRFRDAGWQTSRFLKAIETTDSFYCQDVVQVRIDSWHKGRVVLLGDAAHCPSPFTAMGTTSAFVGAYVLAGELVQSNGDLPTALANYERTLRPFVDEIQKINPRLIRMGFLESLWAIVILRWFAWLLVTLRIPDLISRFSSSEKGGWPLPEYGSLDVLGT